MRIETSVFSHGLLMRMGTRRKPPDAHTGSAKIRKDFPVQPAEEREVHDQLAQRLSVSSKAARSFVPVRQQFLSWLFTQQK